MKLRKFKFTVKYIQEWHKIYQILFAISTNVMSCMSTHLKYGGKVSKHIRRGVI